MSRKRDHAPAALILSSILFLAGAAQADPCPEDERKGQQANKQDDLPPLMIALDRLKQLTAGERKISAKRYFVVPTSKTCSSLTYEFPETRVSPGQALYFDVPTEFRDRPVTFVTIGHRQNPSDPSNYGLGATEHDSKPGLTSTQILTTGYEGADNWRYWAGSASGAYGAKFAELRGSPEIEHLYEWRKIGHYGVGSKAHETTPIKPQAIRMVSNGSDDVLMSSIKLLVQPPKPDKYVEHEFSKGTRLGDPETTSGRAYGGGQGHGGKFPGALALGHWPRAEPRLPKGWKHESSILRIPLAAGQKLTAVEVACGDTHPDGIINKDGGTGSSGYSKLSIYLDHADGSTDTLLNHENVPPQGVLTGFPPSCDSKTREGDTLVIKASDDTTYIMGLRIGLKND